MNKSKDFTRLYSLIHYFAIREAGALGWRMMTIEGGEAKLRPALDVLEVTPVEIREVITVGMNSPPEGLRELVGPDPWTGHCHDWVFDAAIGRWRAPDEALTPLPGEPEVVDTLVFKLEIPHIGWMPVTITAGGQSVTFEASTVFDPFLELTPWLEKLAAGGAPRLLINTEGVIVGLHIFEPEGDTVRFVVTNDVNAENTVDLDIRMDRTALVRAIYHPFVTFWEDPSLARAWRAEWRYSDDPDDDPDSPTNRPYSVRSNSSDQWM